MLDGKNHTLTTFTVSDNKLKSGSDELAFTGTVPVGDSYVKINEDGDVALRITDGKYYASKDYDEAGVVLALNEEAALTREELAQELSDLKRNFQTLQASVDENSTTIANHSTSITNIQNENRNVVATITDLQTNINVNTTSINSINSNINDMYSKYTPIAVTKRITTSTTRTYTGVNASIPADSYFCISAMAIYGSSKPQELIISNSSSEVKIIAIELGSYSLSTSYCSYVTNATTYYVWATYAGATDNSIRLYGFYVQK